MRKVLDAAAALLVVIILTIYFAWPKLPTDVVKSSPSRAESGGEPSSRVAPVPVNSLQPVASTNSRPVSAETRELARRAGERA